MERLYDLGKNVQATLDKAFTAKGVQGAKRYIDAWSGSVYMSWNDAGPLYEKTKESLSQSLAVVRSQRGASLGQMTYLFGIMQTYQQRHRRIGSLMQSYASGLADT